MGRYEVSHCVFWRVLADLYHTVIGLSELPCINITFNIDEMSNIVISNTWNQQNDVPL
jgi:hypothetical protein